MFVRSLLIAFLLFSVQLHAQAKETDDAAESEEGEPSSSPEPENVQASASTPDAKMNTEDELGLSGGFVLQGRILEITDTEVVFQESGAAAPGRYSVGRVQFARTGNGDYRFFAASQIKSERPVGAAEEKWRFYLILGLATHITNNSDTEDYIAGISAYAARYFNQQLNPKGFTSSVTSGATALQFEYFAEPRVAYRRFQFGLSLGYASFPKIVGTVSSPYYSPYLISLDGYFLPMFFITYYQVPLSDSFALNLGIGGGVLYTSIDYNEKSSSIDSSQKYTGVNAAAMLKPELVYTAGRLLVTLSIPVYLAESRKVESGSTSLVNGDSGKVISPNLSGFGLSLAVGYQLR